MIPRLPQTFAERIDERERMTGRTIRMPLPEVCQAIWDRACEDGTLRLGTLYALSESLSSGAGGQMHRESRDIWIVAGDDPGKAAGRLLHELGHVRRQSAPARTVAEDWTEEILTFQEAQSLATLLGVADRIPAGWFEDQIAWNVQLLEYHEQTALLVGSRHPGMARCAFLAVEDLAHAQHWSDEQLEAALYGTLDGDPASDAVFLDRSFLRTGWRLSFGTERDFGAIALAPTQLGVALLREALAQVARDPCDALPWITSEQQPALRMLHLPPFDSSHLTLIVGAVNAVLLDEPDALPGAFWQVYGSDKTPHLYHLTANFSDDFWERREVWIWAPGRHERDRDAEAGFQGYLRSWRTVPIRFDGDLALGMTALFESLPQR